jgi:tetratricopeptide (TPR) repeat protein
MHFTEYKRALYDFSAAIRAESRSAHISDEEKQINFAKYYMYAGQCN